MAEISVRVLDEQDWTDYREVRLRALQDAPAAFAAAHDQEADYPESRWRDRMNRSRRLLATNGDGTTVGVVSVGTFNVEEEGVGELFGLWVQPESRGSGVARKLLEAAATQARKDELRHLVYWVGTDNGRAVAFASSFGFRPTDARRPMTIVDDEGDEEDAEETAMVLPLGDYSGMPTSL